MRLEATRAAKAAKCAPTPEIEAKGPRGTEAERAVSGRATPERVEVLTPAIMPETAAGGRATPETAERRIFGREILRATVDGGRVSLETAATSVRIGPADWAEPGRAELARVVTLGPL